MCFWDKPHTVQDFNEPSLVVARILSYVSNRRFPYRSIHNLNWMSLVEGQEKSIVPDSASQASHCSHEMVGSVGQASM